MGEELAELEVFQCHECNINFLSEGELKGHNVEIHEANLSKKLNLLAKVALLEKNASEQKMRLVSNLFSLKRKERKSKM